MIELKHLRTLQALHRYGSLAAAAAQLHQTQSALSHQFSDLEQRLGYRLFVRKSQPLRLTPQGETLLALAQHVLPQVQQALQQCQAPACQTLRLAIECHSCIQWLTPALNQFQAAFPQVTLDFHSGVTFNPQPALQRGELDLVLTSDILPRSTLHYASLFDYEVRLVMAPSHPLARRAMIRPQDLAQETLLIYPVAHQRLDIWSHFLQPNGITPRWKPVDNTLLLLQMVAAGMGVAALPHWVADNGERQGALLTRPLGGGLWRRLYAALRTGEQRQPVMHSFIQQTRRHACDQLPFVRDVARPSAGVPRVTGRSPSPPASV